VATAQESFDKFTKQLKAGEVLFKQGDLGEHMFIIQTGKVEVYIKGQNGDKSLAFFGPGDFFGEMSIIEKAPRSANARAAEETRLIMLDERTFDLHVQANPAIVRKILKNMSARLRDTNRQLQNLLIKDINRRIANQILLMSHQHGIKGAGGIKMDVPFGEAELAKDTGLTDELPKLREVLEKLKSSKIIDIQGGQILVLSTESLEKFIQFLQMKEEFGF
jgi:CRP/FNR family cyclic AMP-dependent transcriptional regulator